MRVLGEIHTKGQLDFPYPQPPGRYDAHGIGFLQSQMDQGIAVTGIVKSFRGRAEKFILENGGRIVQLVRNPMEVAGSNMYKKPGSAPRMLGHKARDQLEDFLAHVLYYERTYSLVIGREAQEPIIRIEDLNRSCGGDGLFFKAVMEYVTQTEWPIGYVRHIQENYLPGYRYPVTVVKKNGVVVGIESAPFSYEPWRMSWGDDPRPREHWDSWAQEERDIAREALGEVSKALGYNCWDNPGFTELDWPLRDHFPWAKAGRTLAPVPHNLDFESRLTRRGESGLPAYVEEP
jgi:hypothetical protein